MTGLAVPRSLDFRAVRDEPIGSELAEIFHEYWPAYERWMRKAKGPPNKNYRSQLRAYMPELYPIYEQLVESFGGDELVAKFLALYNPPRVVRGCSQIVIDSDDGPILVRSYDHHPALIDALIVRSCWNSQSVLAMADCIWGALDGINEHGLAVSLSFGGRDKIGPGFASTLITRYILETCTSVKEAKAILSNVPVYMPYTFLVVDASGNFTTAFTGPDQPTRFVKKRASTNHQSTNDWPEYCRFTKSVERLRALESTLEHTENDDSIKNFLRPPLWRSDYAQASGTLYVSEYRTSCRSLTLHWPERTEKFSLNDFTPRSFQVPV